MKIIDPEQLDDKGRMMLFYGETGVGKTLSILISAPKPILWLPMERKDVKKNYGLAMELGKLSKGDIDIAYYENWQDSMDFFFNPESTAKYSTIFPDGLTHLMGIDMLQEIENQSILGMKKSKDLMDKIKDKPLAYLTKGGMENYGTLNTITIRMLEALTHLHEHGKCIVFSALLDENPAWNRELTASPLISGKAFSKSIPVFFGTIGLVISRLSKEGQQQYPPKVMLRSNEGDFMARFTGRPSSATTGPLDIQKIMEL